MKSSELDIIFIQKLSDLRDAITCRADLMVIGEYSNNPDLTGSKTTKVSVPLKVTSAKNRFLKIWSL